jgi:hypothetical protein
MNADLFVRYKSDPKDSIRDDLLADMNLHWATRGPVYIFTWHSRPGYVQIGFTSQAKYDEAEPMNRRVLVRREKVWGMDHPDTSTSVYCLTDLLGAKQDRHEALKLYHRAVEGYTKILGRTHPTTRACQRHKRSEGEGERRYSPNSVSSGDSARSSYNSRSEE